MYSDLTHAHNVTSTRHSCHEYTLHYTHTAYIVRCPQQSSLHMALHKYTLAHALQHSYHHEDTALATQDLGSSLHVEHQDNHAHLTSHTHKILPAHKFALRSSNSLAPSLNFTCPCTLKTANALITLHTSHDDRWCDLGHPLCTHCLAHSHKCNFHTTAQTHCLTHSCSGTFISLV